MQPNQEVEAVTWNRQIASRVISDGLTVIPMKCRSRRGAYLEDLRGKPVHGLGSWIILRYTSPFDRRVRPWQEWRDVYNVRQLKSKE
jgi:hypothetical protein